MKHILPKKNHRGFTIVELAVVVAIVAILAAVLVPTIIGIVNKAEIAADKQNVSGANTVLAASSAGSEPQTVGEVALLLKEGGYDLQTFQPGSAGNHFLWDKVSNQIIYTDENYALLYAAKEFSEENCELWEPITSPEQIDDSAEHIGYYLAADCIGNITVNSPFAVGAGVTVEGEINVVGAELSVGGTVVGEICAEEGKITVEKAGNASSLKLSPLGGNISVDIRSCVAPVCIKIESDASGSVDINASSGAVGAFIDYFPQENSSLAFSAEGNVFYSVSTEEEIENCAGLALPGGATYNSGVAFFAAGTQIEPACTAAEGYVFSHFLINGNVSEGDTFVMPNHSVKLSAVFKEQEKEYVTFTFIVKLEEEQSLNNPIIIKENKDTVYKEEIANFSEYSHSFDVEKGTEIYLSLNKDKTQLTIAFNDFVLEIKVSANKDGYEPYYFYETVSMLTLMSNETVYIIFTPSEIS